MLNINKDPVKIQVEEWMNEKAEMAKSKGPYNKSSHLKGGGNFSGKIGECFWYSYLYDSFGERIKWVNENDCDYFLYNKTFTDKLLLESKSKTQNVVYLENYYDCTIYDTSLHQQFDIALFSRLHRVKDKNYDCYDFGWLMGWKKLEDYHKLSRHLVPGTIDGKNNFKVKDDVRNLKYIELEPVSTLLPYIEDYFSKLKNKKIETIN